MPGTSASNRDSVSRDSAGRNAGSFNDGRGHKVNSRCRRATVAASASLAAKNATSWSGSVGGRSWSGFRTADRAVRPDSW